MRCIISELVLWVHLHTHIQFSIKLFAINRGKSRTGPLAWPTDSSGKWCCTLYINSPNFPQYPATQPVLNMVQYHRKLTSPNCCQLPPEYQNQRHCVTNFSVSPPPAEMSWLSSAYEHVDRRRTCVLYWQPPACSPTMYSALNESKCIHRVTTCPACTYYNQYIHYIGGLALW